MVVSPWWQRFRPYDADDPVSATVESRTANPEPPTWLRDLWSYAQRLGNYELAERRRMSAAEAALGEEVRSLRPVETAASALLGSIPGSLGRRSPQRLPGEGFEPPGYAEPMWSGAAPTGLEGYEPGALEGLASQVGSFAIDTAMLQPALGPVSNLAGRGAEALAGRLGPSFGPQLTRMPLRTAYPAVAARSGTFLGGLMGAQEAAAGGGPLEIAGAMGHGGVMGAALGPVGMATKGAPLLGRLGAEVAGLGTVSAGLQGRMPTVEDYVGAAGMVLGLKAPGAAAGAGRALFRASKGLNLSAAQRKLVEAITPEQRAAIGRVVGEERGSVGPPPEGQFEAPGSLVGRGAKARLQIRKTTDRARPDNPEAWLLTGTDRLGRQVQIIHPDRARVEEIRNAYRMGREDDVNNILLRGTVYEQRGTSLAQEIREKAQTMSPEQVEAMAQYAERQVINWRDAVAEVEAKGRNSIDARAMVEKWQDEARLWRQQAPPAAEAVGAGLVAPTRAGEAAIEADWQIAQRRGGVATEWTRPGATIKLETRRPKTTAGLGGRRYYVRVGREEQGFLELADAQDWADRTQSFLASVRQPPPAAAEPRPSEGPAAETIGVGSVIEQIGTPTMGLAPIRGTIEGEGTWGGTDNQAIWFVRQADGQVRPLPKEMAQLAPTAPAAEAAAAEPRPTEGAGVAEVEVASPEARVPGAARIAKPRVRGGGVKPPSAAEIAEAERAAAESAEFVRLQDAGGGREPPLWIDEFQSVGGKWNPDGTVDLYHATTQAGAKQILADGILRRPSDAPDSYGVYFSSSPSVAHDYGDGTLVRVRVKASALHPDDIFPGQRMDFTSPTRRGVFRPIAVEIVQPPSAAPLAEPPREPPEDMAARVPLFITRQMNSDLKAAGFTPAQIKKMTPQEAWDNLGGMRAAVEPPAAVKPRPSEGAGAAEIAEAERAPTEVISPAGAAGVPSREEILARARQQIAEQVAAGGGREPPTTEAMAEERPFTPPMTEGLRRQMGEAERVVAREAGRGGQPPTGEPPTTEGIPPSGAEPPGGEGVPPYEQPPSRAEQLGENVIGLRNVSPGLTRRQERLNLARQTLNKVGFSMVEDNAIATPIMAERARVQEPIRSVANDFAARNAVEAKRVFTFDKTGLRIPDLADVDPRVPGAPALADVAARLPLYRERMTAEQVAFVERAIAEVAEYHALLEQVGIEIPSRPDVMEGGGYLPRGRADIEGADLPLKVGAGFGRGARKGFEKPAVFDSQAQGIEAGYKYSSFHDTLQSYGRDAGTRAADAHTVNAFKAAIDAEGNLIAETAADRIDPALRDRVNGLRAKIATRFTTLQRQETRGAAQTAEAKRRARDMARMEKRIGSVQWVATEVARAAKEGTLYGNVDAALAETRKALLILQQEGRYASKRLTEADKRAGETLSRYDKTQAAIREFREELNGLGGEWEKAKKRAAQTPREQGMIGLSGLTGYTFPDAIANAANQVLQAEGPPRGAGASVVRVASALNNGYRWFTATADNSALGIQALLSTYSDPKAAAAAARVNVLAWGRGGDDVLGKYFNDHNRMAESVGAPSAQEWARAGLHLGGQASEFAMQGPAQRIPPIRLANRAFGYLGDALRVSRSHDEFIRRARQTGLSKEQLAEQGELDRIATAINGETGWARQRFAGDLGELALYAPRFFQSRLETVVRGVAGMRPGAPLEQRIARQSLLKMIGWGTVFTVALNAMQGQETDFRPFLPDAKSLMGWKFNSDFMKVRAFGRDWSLFGTWESLVGAIARTATGDPAGALRGLGSGVVSLGWDLIGNKDWDGEPVRNNPEQFARWLLESLTPFSWQELPEVVGRATTGDIPGAAALFGGEMVGAKSSLVRPYELRSEAMDKAAQAELGVSWDETGKRAQKEMRKLPEIAEAEKQLELERAAEPKRAFQLSQEAADASNNVRSKAPKIVQEEMARLGVDMPTFARTVGGWWLNDARYQQWQDDMVREMAQYAEAIQDSRWAKLTDAAKKKKLEDAIRDDKKAAYDAIEKAADALDRERQRQMQQRQPAAQLPPWANILSGLQAAMAGR